MVVLMGWPMKGERFPTAPKTSQLCIEDAVLYPQVLDDFRRCIQKFSVLHAYHSRLSDVDNDFFFRIGLIDPNAATADQKSELVFQVREFLRTEPQLRVEIGTDQVCVAVYRDETLPVTTTKTLCLSEFSATHLGQVAEG